MDKISKSYENLKEIIINSSKDGNFDVNPLKDLYSSQINSIRTYYQIKDLRSLVSILEKRDVLDPENVEPLECIFNALNLSPERLIEHKLLINQRASNSSRQLFDHNRFVQRPYQEFNHLSKTLPTSTSKTQTENRQHRKLPDEVVSAVASQIGYSWKPLARYLGNVKEGTLEKIEEDQSITSNEMRARLMLAEYEREVDPSKLCSTLLKALELSKRMDLHEKVLKILLREARP